MDVIDISAGEADSMFVTKNGEVYVMGGMTLGWVNGIAKPLTKPTKISHLTNIVRIENMSGGVIALNNKGEIYTTGAGSLGRMVERVSQDKPPYYPAKKVDLPRKAVDIAVSISGCMVLLDNGEVWVWGGNSGARLALPKGLSPELPIKHPDLKRIVNIGDRSAVDVDGNLYTWGAIGYGSPLAPSQKIYRRPVKIAENVNPAMLIRGGFAYGVLDKQGHLYTWGWDEHGQLGTGQLPSKEISKKEVMTLYKSLFTTH